MTDQIPPGETDGDPTSHDDVEPNTNNHVSDRVIVFPGSRRLVIGAVSVTSCVDVLYRRAVLRR